MTTPKTIFIVEKWYKIRDAVKPTSLHILPKDWRRNTCADPHNCLAANCGKRTKGGIWSVYKTITYWVPDKNGDRAIRYRNFAPKGNLSTTEIVAMHDESKSENPVPPGGFIVRMHPPKGSAKIAYAHTPAGRIAVAKGRARYLAKKKRGEKPRRYARSLSATRRFTMDKRVAR